MLRQATTQDMETVRRWRNHPRVRSVSITQHEITPEEHANWWRLVEADPRRQVLISQYRGLDSGVVTYVLEEDDPSAATWGFYLDIDGLESRASLMPAWLELERDAVRYGFQELGLDRLGGETLASNTPVLQLHRRFGFQETRTFQRIVNGEPRDIVWTELTRQQARV